MNKDTAKKELALALIGNSHASRLLRLLGKPAAEREALELVVAAREMVNRTPIEQLPGLIAALVAPLRKTEFAVASRTVGTHRRPALHKRSITPAQLKAKFKRQGKSFAAWARKNNYEYHTVICVLNGQSKATRGRGHEIAVKLGLKQDTANHA